MKDIISVDPFRCRMWEFHDRLEQHVDESSCKVEIASFLKYGQLVPALGRRLRGVPDYDVELVYGARRLFVARHLNKQILVELRDMSVAEAVAAMDIENRHRLDISAYERGRSYVNWLRARLFNSQEEISRELKISSSQVSRLIKLAQLPSVVVAAFRSPADICETWAHDLCAVLDDPQRRVLTCARARVIAALPTRPEPRDILRQLLRASTPGRKVRTSRHDQVVTGRGGKPLFRIRHLSNKIALVLPVERVGAERMAQISAAVTRILEDSPLPQVGSRRVALQVAPEAATPVENSLNG